MHDRSISAGVRVHIQSFITLLTIPLLSITILLLLASTCPNPTVGFFVAFLSWFAFPPLIPDAIKSDLHLSAAQVANSNIIALCATFVVRAGVGPLVDRYGPRKVMACLLVLGAIPSGLAGTAQSAEGLYVLRFFIGILGATFVPCQAWTSAFFDKNCVGTANALVGGWGEYSSFHGRGSILTHIFKETWGEGGLNS